VFGDPLHVFGHPQQASYCGAAICCGHASTESQLCSVRELIREQEFGPCREVSSGLMGRPTTGGVWRRRGISVCHHRLSPRLLPLPWRTRSFAAEGNTRRFGARRPPPRLYSASRWRPRAPPSPRNRGDRPRYGLPRTAVPISSAHHSRPSGDNTGRPPPHLQLPPLNLNLFISRNLASARRSSP
jgi:hypothetical protein